MNERIHQLQKEIAEKRKEILALRKQVPLEIINDYTFKDKDGKEVTLSSLFDERDELMVVHNMGKECSYCTMWADGLRGYSEIISDRMPWVLVSPNEFAVMEAFAAPRNWNFRYLSFHGTDFGYDLGYEKRKGEHSSFHPGVSALIRKDGKIYRAAQDAFGPGDDYNPAWHFFSLFPKGYDNWVPKYEYQ